MAKARRALMLLLCVCVAASVGAESKKDKKEEAADKKEVKSERSKAKKDEAADAKKGQAAGRSWKKQEAADYKRDRATDRAWEKKQAAAEKKEWRARHGYHSFSHDHYVTYRNYYVRTYGMGRCPPGYVSSYGNCYWPGYTRKRYAVGEVIPDDVPLLLPPVDLVREIGQPPPGYMFVLVDGDLVEILIENHLVVDVVDGGYGEY
jgi:hypothetical protein